MATKQIAAKRTRASAGRMLVVATNADYANLCAKAIKRLGSPKNVQLKLLPSTSRMPFPAVGRQSTVFVSRLSDIPGESAYRFPAGGTYKQVLFLEGLPVEAVPARLLRLNIRDPQRLHIAARREPTAISDLVYRLVNGALQVNGMDRIVDAWIEDKRLVLLAPSFMRLEVPLAKLQRFIGSDQSQAAQFEIDEDGRYLHWPHADTHLGWMQLQQLVDPASAIAHLEKSLRFNVRYGAAIRNLRESRELKQTEIDGITDRHLRRVEHGKQSVTKSLLTALARAHGLTLENYLERLAKLMAS